MDWCPACHGLVDAGHRCRVDPTPMDVTDRPPYEWRVGDTLRWALGPFAGVLVRIDQVNDVDEGRVFAFTVVDVDPLGGA